MQDLAGATIRGTLWTYASIYGGKLLNFISTTILAWLLLKEDFGLAGYALVVINFLNVLSDLGVGMALIYHRKKPKIADTAFWLSLLTGVVLFALTWLIAPLVGTFFNDLRAVPLTRVLGLSFPISALSNVQGSLLQKQLDFKRKFIPDVIRAASKGIISIVLALLGLGAWSLVIGQVGGLLVSTLSYWRAVPWRPAFNFVSDQARALLGYGVSIIAVNALGVFLLNVDYLLVGRYMGAVALGVYTLAFRVPELLIKQFCGTLAKVIFPVYAKLRDQPTTLNQAFIATMRYVTMITIPLGLGLALLAEPFVLTFFSAKWEEAIPVMRAISIYALLLSLAFNAGDIFKAQGRMRILTNLQLVRAAVLMPALWWATTQIGTIVAVGWTQAAVALFSSSLDLTVAAHMFKTPIRQVLGAFGPSFTSGALMAAGVYGCLLMLSAAPPILQLLVCVVVGAAIYLGTLWLLQRKLVLESKAILRAALLRR